MSIRIAVVTTGRADYGLLRPLLLKLSSDSRFSAGVIVTGSHLVEAQGMTVERIAEDGFEILAMVPLPDEGDERLATVHAIGAGVSLLGDAISEARPDVVVILGDRFEALAAAVAAVTLDVPIAHIHGGELTFGSVDDAFRHAITQMATLHFAATEEYRRRIVQMGRPVDGVFNVGALAVDNVRSTELLDEDAFEREYGFGCGRDTLLVTYHPVTRTGDAGEEAGALLRAFESLSEFKIVFTAPNMDAGGRGLRERIEQWVASNSSRARLVPSLGLLGYLSAARNCAAVVGNSSSGLIEVPAMGVPSVNVGMRQAGRMQPPSVVQAPEDVEGIAEAIRKATSDEFRRFAAAAPNPYGRGNAAVEIAEILADRELLKRMRVAGFSDLACEEIS